MNSNPSQNTSKPKRHNRRPLKKNYKKKNSQQIASTSINDSHESSGELVQSVSSHAHHLSQVSSNTFIQHDRVANQSTESTTQHVDRVVNQSIESTTQHVDHVNETETHNDTGEKKMTFMDEIKKIRQQAQQENLFKKSSNILRTSSTVPDFVNEYVDLNAYQNIKNASETSMYFKKLYDTINYQLQNMVQYKPKRSDYEMMSKRTLDTEIEFIKEFSTQRSVFVIFFNHLIHKFLYQDNKTRVHEINVAKNEPIFSYDQLGFTNSSKNIRFDNQSNVNEYAQELNQVQIDRNDSMDDTLDWNVTQDNFFNSENTIIRTEQNELSNTDLKQALFDVMLNMSTITNDECTQVSTCLETFFAHWSIVYQNYLKIVKDFNMPGVQSIKDYSQITHHPQHPYTPYDYDTVDIEDELRDYLPMYWQLGLPTNSRCNDDTSLNDLHRFDQVNIVFTTLSQQGSTSDWITAIINHLKQTNRFTMTMDATKIPKSSSPSTSASIMSDNDSTIIRRLVLVFCVGNENYYQHDHWVNFYSKSHRTVHENQIGNQHWIIWPILIVPNISEVRTYYHILFDRHNRHFEYQTLDAWTKTIDGKLATSCDRPVDSLSQNQSTYTHDMPFTPNVSLQYLFTNMEYPLYFDKFNTTEHDDFKTMSSLSHTSHQKFNVISKELKYYKKYSALDSSCRKWLFEQYLFTSPTDNSSSTNQIKPNCVFHKPTIIFSDAYYNRKEKKTRIHLAKFLSDHFSKDFIASWKQSVSQSCSNTNKNDVVFDPRFWIDLDTQNVTNIADHDASDAATDPSKPSWFTALQTWTVIPNNYQIHTQRIEIDTIGSIVDHTDITRYERLFSNENAYNDTPDVHLPLFIL